MASDWISFALVMALTFLVGALVMSSRLPKSVKILICLALAFRVGGAFVRYWVVFEYYGAGDAIQYFNRGLEYADSFREFDFSPLLESTYWRGGTWYGTQFLRFVSAGVLLFISPPSAARGPGPLILSEFVVFSLLAFVGLVGFAVAFRRAYPHVPWSRYLRWIWFFPSLWFWPASVGKEAILMLGLGVAVFGFIGRNGRVNWPLLAGGMFVVFGVRPQFAAVLFMSMILSQWLFGGGRWTFSRVLQGVLVLAVGILGVWYSMRSAGMEEFDVEGVANYIEIDPARETDRGTNIDAVSVGWKGLPIAAVNILFRPLPWEGTNILALFSSMEILGLWAIVFYRRRNLVRSLRNWRSDRFRILAITFILIYSVSLGLMLVNLGIIARQRVFLFPFLFLLIESEPGRVRDRVRMTRAPLNRAAWQRLRATPSGVGK